MRHFTITQCSPKRVWEVVKNNEPWDELITKVPDELYKQMTEYKDYLLNEYAEIDYCAGREYLDVMLNLSKSHTISLPIRKDIDHEIFKSKHPEILFSKLDDKDYDEYIWKLLEPDALMTFDQIMEKQND